MDGVLIEAAGKDDLPKILQLQRAAFRPVAEAFRDKDIEPLTATLDDLEREFDAGIFLKAVLVDEIIGSIRAHAEGSTVHVGKLIVHPKFQHRGLGRKLLAAIERHCPAERCELFTDSRNRRNLALYERAGYRKFSERQVNDELMFAYLEKFAPPKG